MNLLPFGKLPPHKPRTFIPADIDLGDWAQIAPLFDHLEKKGQQAATPAELERWLLDWSELNAALDEEGNRRNIAMTCHTDNPGAEKAFLHFVENVEPHVKPRQFALETLFANHPQRASLPASRFEVFQRDIRNRVALYRAENIPLETEEARLGQQFQKLSGSLTVNFRGEEKTLIQMGVYQEDTERSLRQQAWELVANRRLQEADKFDDLFDALVQQRHQIALNAGFPNYRDYMFRRKGRFDYTPEDCAKFHEAVESEVMPAVRELHTNRQRQLGVPELRPWDLGVDPQNRAPLKPFADVNEMVARTQKIFNHLDGQLAGEFQMMQDLRVLDLDNRKGKAPGGYQANLAESRVPFIFMNSVGQQRDVETILHEAGHAFHALAARNEDLFHYREAPIEFCEVASMAMELLCARYLEEFYTTAEANRARRVHLEKIIEFFPWMATVDAFQHWIYTHPGHTRAERAAAWDQLMSRFGGLVDWTGYEKNRASLWQRQLHIFLYPFYYVEYGIAQLGALQVWANAKSDPAKALADYKRGLALGGSRPLPELFRAAGCQFDFSAQTIRPLIQLARSELAELPA